MAIDQSYALNINNDERDDGVENEVSHFRITVDGYA